MTRRGAVRAGGGDLGIVPGRLGNAASFDAASRGAGRRMRRNAAKKRCSAKDLAEQTKGVECHKGVGDGIPAAYKPIEPVTARSGTSSRWWPS